MVPLPLSEIVNKDSRFGTVVSAIRWLGLQAQGGTKLSFDQMGDLVECFAGKIALAAAGNFVALSEVVGLHPVPVLHAISMLQPSTQRQEIALLYLQALEICSEHGIEVLGSESHELCDVLLTELGISIKESRHSSEQNATEQGFTPNTFARLALEASDFGRFPLRFEHSNLKAVSRSSLLLAARRRNYSDAGLLLLSHSIVFPQDDVEHILDWLERTRRSDGLYGPWELFPGGCTGANLSANVNVVWGQVTRSRLSGAASVRARPDLTDLLPEDLFAEVDRAEIQQGINELKSWIDDSIPDFCHFEFRDQSDLADKLKPLIELALTTWIVKQVEPVEGPNRNWAIQVAQVLGELVDEEKLIEGFRIFPTFTLALLMYPLIERTCGRRSRHAEELYQLAVDRYSTWQERVPMRRMDYHFLRWLFGVNEMQEEQSILTNLNAALISGDVNPCYLSNDSAYDITHALFYATRFGTCALPPSHPALEWSQKWLPELCLSYLLEGDCDIGGELLLNWLQLGLPKDGSFWLAIRILLGNISSSGFAHGPPAVARRDEIMLFAKHYHTTLISLAALVAAVQED